MYSPYRCAQIVNALLASEGIDKVLPPQMFYTYVKKGYILSVEGKVSADTLTAWYNKYAQKFQTASV